MSTISKCKCESEFQDMTYGKNKRLFNKTIKDNIWRCSVCGETSQISSSKSPEEKKK